MLELEFVEGINQISDFVIDIRNELLDLTLGVKDLDRLCVRVIADSKWPWNCCSKVTEICNYKCIVIGECYSHHFLLSVLETLRDVVERLVLSDGIFLDSSLLRLKAAELRLARQTPLQLPEGGEQAGTEGLQLALLPGDAELDGEPVAGGELLDVVIAGAQAGQANLLAELGEGGVSKEGDVAQQLVADVRLGCVHRGAVVSDVLGGVEHPECQPGQEVSGGEQSGHRSQLEPGNAWQVKFILQVSTEQQLHYFSGSQKPSGAEALHSRCSRSSPPGEGTRGCAHSRRESCRVSSGC